MTAYDALPTFFIVAMREMFNAGPLESALGIAAIGALSGGAILAAVGAVLLGTDDRSLANAPLTRSSSSAPR